MAGESIDRFPRGKASQPYRFCGLVTKGTRVVEEECVSASRERKERIGRCTQRRRSRWTAG